MTAIYNGRETAHSTASTTHTLVHVMTVPMSLVFLRGQPEFMRARGFDVVAASSSGPELEAFRRAESVPTYAVEMPRQITPFNDLRALVALCRLFRRVRPDIVHSHTPKGGLLGTLAAVLTGVPVRIYHIRGLPFLTAKGFRRRLLQATEWLACSCATRVLCVSGSVRQIAVDHGLCSRDRIAVLLHGSGNGVDAAIRFNPERWAHTRAETRAALGIPADAQVVGFVGRIVPDKGIVELVEAWRTLRESCPDAYLVVIGFLEGREPLPRAVANELRDDPRVRLTGRLPDAARFYAAVDVVALPSHREGFPNVPLEAAAMELPVVATRIPGCVDAVQHGTTGVLVPLGDVPALAEAIATYLRSPELRQSHGRAGRARVLEHFRPERIWEALHAEYVRLLAHAAASPTPAGNREMEINV